MFQIYLPDTWLITYHETLNEALKIVNLCWNLVTRIIRICKSPWWCSLFLFISEIAFWVKFGPKNQNYQFKLKLGTKINSNMQNSVVIFIFPFLDRKYPFWVNLVQKSKIVSLNLNLIPTLLQVCKIRSWCLLILFHTFFRRIFRKIPFGNLVLPDQSSGSLLAVAFQASNPHFGFPSY